MILCAGPGSEEESQSHEKMYFILREGPIHRCSMCGQCFKLVRLKDDLYDEANHYYSSVFTEISPNTLSDPEMAPWLSFPYAPPGDAQTGHPNSMPTKRAFTFVNADEADHILVDPAYRMEKYKELEDSFVKYNLVKDEVEKQSKMLNIHSETKIHITADLYERWTEVEKEIFKFDRLFNRQEKFLGRQFFDPENHDRREKRMLERKAIREKDNYTYYFGGLTEEEQMFRDYYESDLENDAYPDSEKIAEVKTENMLRASGDFDLSKFELLDPYLPSERHEHIDDIIGKSIFKYKYRKLADPQYEQRNERVVRRFFERAQKRNKEIFNDLGDKLEDLYVDNQLNLNIIDRDGKFSSYSKYVAEEGYQQFRDYYESDIEEGAEAKKELFEDLPEREKLRFSECYENFFNQGISYDAYYVSIPKRPYNSNKSIVSNFVCDLIDFNSRVRPIMRNLAFKDAAAKHQALPVTEEENKSLEEEQTRYKKVLNFKKSGSNLLEQFDKKL